jgi:hypothetical protein
LLLEQRVHYSHHLTDAALKLPSLKAFHKNGRIPIYSHPAKIVLMKSKTECAEAIIVLLVWS